MKQTVLQAEIERQEKKLKKLRRKHSDGIGGDYAWYERYGAITAMESVIKSLKSLLPASEQELKDAFNEGYRCGESELPSNKGDVSEYDDANNWFKNEFGQG
jgi:predicted secreted protein